MTAPNRLTGRFRMDGPAGREMVEELVLVAM
jgi:hypothetical protein